jgi:hypothetical protein
MGWQQALPPHDNLSQQQLMLPASTVVAQDVINNQVIISTVLARVHHLGV